MERRNSGLRTVVRADYEQMSQETARRMAQAVRRKPDALLCLPAGESAMGAFALLAQMAHRGEVRFDRARFVPLDEWLDIEDEDQNCAAFLDRHVFRPLGVRPDQVRPFDIHAPDLAAECRAMDAFIQREGPIDLMLLGLGMNGHLGLNEPGTSWDLGTAVVGLSQTTRQVGQKYFRGGQRLTRGITLGMRHMFEAKEVVLQVGGKHKAGIVKAVYDAQPTIDLPATALKRCNNAWVILDRDAASLLDAPRD